MRARAASVAFAAALAVAGCNAILGNSDHQLAPAADAAGAVSDGGDAGSAADAPAADAPVSDASTEAAPEASPGGPVPPTSGGIYSVGRVPDDASAGVLPGGGTVTLTDDGFEFGETQCNGTICVTGAITP
jgi:hypothetical protein